MIRVKLKISIFALIDSISLINQRTMTIQQLEYILAVDQFRHFAKAAEYCRVTQPTLSAMIQKLEDELGVKLFDRSMTPVCPTAIGKKVLEQARKILSEVICVKEDHQRRTALPVGYIPIGSVTDDCTLSSAPFLSATDGEIPGS